MEILNCSLEEIECAITGFREPDVASYSNEVNALFDDCTKTIDEIAEGILQRLVRVNKTDLTQQQIQESEQEVFRLLESEWGFDLLAEIKSRSEDINNETPATDTAADKEVPVPSSLSAETSKSNKDCENGPLTTVEQIFRSFPESDILKRIFSSPRIANAIKILPYLLTAYYLYAVTSDQILTEKGRKDILAADKKASNYRHWVTRLSSSFSMANFLEYQIGAVRSEYRPQISNITSEDAFEKELLYPQKKKYNELHAAAIIQSFFYSMFTFLCSKQPEISKRIDYKLSFDLFDQHTRAFRVGICPDSREVQDKYLEYDDQNNRFSPITSIIREEERKNPIFSGPLMFSPEKVEDNANHLNRAYDWCSYRFDYFGDIGDTHLSALEQWKSAFFSWQRKHDISEEDMYRLQAITHFLYLNPLLYMGTFWPCILPEHYEYSMWDGMARLPYQSEKKLTKDAIQNQLSKLEEISKKRMPWDKVRSLLLRGAQDSK